MAIKIQNDEIEIIDPKKVIIENSDLSKEVQNNKKETLEFLSKEVSVIQLTDLQLDSRGRVVIINPTFIEILRAQKLEDIARGQSPDANGICGLRC